MAEENSFKAFSFVSASVLLQSHLFPLLSLPVNADSRFTGGWRRIRAFYPFSSRGEGVTGGSPFVSEASLHVGIRTALRAELGLSRLACSSKARLCGCKVVSGGYILLLCKGIRPLLVQQMYNERHRKNSSSN